MSLLFNLCQTIDRHCSSVSVVIGKSVAWLTAVMAITTTLVVVSRAFFNSGSVAAQDSVTYMHALVLMCASAYTLRSDGHVRVDIFYRRYSPVQKALLDALGTLLLLLPFCVFTIAVSWQYVANAWAIREGSADAGGIPGVFLLKTLIPLNGALLALQGIAEMMRQLAVLTYVNDDE
ncbi:MAG: TRAP transporter small permease subunit [Cellvibrionaceae bacterium]|nr:TRAP transporter small permease subunit [Cellvibrionaceae bacterium]